MIDIDHIGIAVADTEPYERLFKDLFNAAPYKSEDIQTQGVRTHFIDAGGAKLELLEALSPSSPIARYLEKHKAGMHHMAFEVKNIRATWKRVTQKGYTPLGDRPQPGADGKLIFFLHPRDTHGILIEFCQSQHTSPEPQWVPYAGDRLAYYELGASGAPPLVILHGAAGCTRMETLPLIRALSNKYRVLALDFAAHGRSAMFSNTPFTAELFVDNVLALFNHLQIPEARLFGFSLGGYIALRFTTEYPERVKKLAAHAVNRVWDEALVQAMIQRLDLESIRQKGEDLVQYLEEMHGPEWPGLFERMQEYTRLLPAYSKKTDPGKVTIPTLLSAVDKDDLFPVSNIVALAQALPGCKLAVIPGQRHAFQSVDLDILLPILKKHFT